MKTKEFNIQIPEGYEIDKENSTFECVKFKPIKKNITYKDIYEYLFKNKNSFYITNFGRVDNYLCVCSVMDNKNNATNRKQLERVLALNQLLNIAEYYNKQNPKQGENPYCITLNEVNEYQEGAYDLSYTSFGLVALFNRKEDAQAVIDNPNFKEILDTIYKDLK